MAVFQVLGVVLLVSVFTAVSAEGGLLSRCDVDDDCADGYYCAFITELASPEIIPCDGEDGCFCYASDADDIRTCEIAVDDCEPNEQCVTPPRQDNSVCADCDDYLFGGIVANNNNCTRNEVPSASVSPIVTPSVSSSGEAMASPSASGQPATTMLIVSPDPSTSPSSGVTVIITPVVTPAVSVSPSSSVMDGESPMPSLSMELTPAASPSSEASVPPSAPGSPIPSTTATDPVETESAAASPSGFTSAAPTEDTPAGPDGSPDATSEDEEGSGQDPICIDADALSHLQSHELVFAEHRRTAVLCDRSGSCATPGHVVVYQDRPMLMKSYCEIVECKRTVKMVNSPRFKRALRISSRTTGLHYTALAARYETRAEEIVLTTMLHMGV